MERELLLCVSRGDEGAFTQLFNAYHQRLGLYVYRLTESRPLTQEIVQDVFVRVWLRREALSSVSSFNAYLFTAARNQALNALKQVARQRSGQAQLEATLGVLASEPSDSDPVEEYRLLLDKAVEKLPGQQQKVYLLHRRQGLSHAEIALQLNLSVETVKKHMSLALRAIRQDLSPAGRHALLLVLTASVVLGG